MSARTLMIVASAAAATLGGGARADEGGGSSAALRAEERRAPAPPELGDFGPRAFVEGGISVFNFTAESSESQIGGTVRAGVLFGRFFAVEADYSQLSEAEGVVVHSASGSGPAGDLVLLREPDRVSTAFARAAWPLSDRLSTHARLGFARLDAENESGGDESAGGAAFGAGASLDFTETVALRADYTRMQLDELEADVGTLVFSVAF